MHRFQSKSVIRRFKLAAYLLCLKCIMCPVAAAILIYSLVKNDRDLTIISIGLIGLTLIVIILQWLVSERTRCPLCMTPVLASKACAKHRKARPFLGSYRLRVALGILFRDSFFCPYCHEPTAMEVRTRENKSKVRHY
jgi:cytochrome bd-type quinol oxidase subunit 1